MREAGRRPVPVASYNVHRCVGVDGRRDPGRIAAVVREIGASIVAVQEVESGPCRHGLAQLDALAAALDLEPVPGATLLNPEAHFGNALLTSLPVLEVRRLDLSVPSREPRGALDVDLDAGDRRLRVVVTHLGLRNRERTIQVLRLLELLGRHDDSPLLLLGDFNEWMPRSRRIRSIEVLLGPAPGPRTFPSWRPVLPLDRIWASPADGLKDVRAHASPLARVASDHLPVVAELEL
jgi:endonuclease/exonuclease/phosphatase family metal-dependent hydrolase